MKPYHHVKMTRCAVRIDLKRYRLQHLSSNIDFHLSALFIFATEYRRSIARQVPDAMKGFLGGCTGVMSIEESHVGVTVNA